MTRFLNSIRAFLRGPSEEALRLDLAILRSRLDRLEADLREEKREAASANILRFVPGRRRGLEG